MLALSTNIFKKCYHKKLYNKSCNLRDIHYDGKLAVAITAI